MTEKPIRSATAAGSAPRRTVAVLVLPEVHLLDLAGPVQAFHEAAAFGAPYRVRFVGTATTARSAQGLELAGLEPPFDVGPGDLVLVPGIESATLDRLEHVPYAWLRDAASGGAEVCSICSGAAVLAHAGLLDGRNCTTHWKLTGLLQRRNPRCRVVEDRLFVRDGNIVTSAGVASGIDTALWLIERDHDPLVAARVARELVVYLRRDGSHRADSVYLDYRTHLHPGVHRVQDWMIAHPSSSPTIAELAEIAGMSARNLTRAFRRATGITLKQFGHRLKLELAEVLLHNPDLTIENVAARCGFRDPRQLRRLWNREFDEAPAVWKAREIEGQTPRAEGSRS